MKFLIIVVFTLATVFGLCTGKKIDSKNIVIAAGNRRGRITHGDIAFEGQFPYQVGIRLYYPNSKYISWCGGTLIGHTDAITAAHCAVGGEKIDVILGSVEMGKGELVHTVPASNAFIHENYVNDGFEDDIAIIQIPYTNYSATIQAANLPTNESFVNKVAIASGWGTTSDSDEKSFSKYLRYVALKVISNSECAESIVLYRNQFCASTDGKTSTCKGDSGSPFVLENTKTLIGITSSGSDNGCEREIPAVFVDVSKYLDWIQDHRYT